MSRIRKLTELMRQGDFRQIWEKGTAFLSNRAYTLFAVQRDKRYGGISVNQMKVSRYSELGAYDSQSSDYRCLRQVFRAVPLRSDDVFIDVGCGEGRVLTYLCEQGFQGKVIGIELDEEIAETAARRTASCKNVTICCGNVLDKSELFRDATAVYLFHPFSRRIFQAFVAMLESNCAKPVRLYYLNWLYVDELENRDRWNLISDGTIYRPGIRPMPFTVHELTPG